MGVMDLKAEVKNGRLVLDEPTDLPEGKVVHLFTVDPPQEMSASERAALTQELRRGIEELDRGEGRPVEEVVADIRRQLG